MALAIFGLITCIALDAPWYAYLLGFFCLLMDS